MNVIRRRESESNDTNDTPPQRPIRCVSRPGSVCGDSVVEEESPIATIASPPAGRTSEMTGTGEKDHRNLVLPETFQDSQSQTNKIIHSQEAIRNQEGRWMGSLKHFQIEESDTSILDQTVSSSSASCSEITASVTTGWTIQSDHPKESQMESSYHNIQPTATMVEGIDNDEYAETAYDNQDKLLIDALTKARESPNPVTPSRPIDLEDGDPVLIERYKRVERVWECMNNHDIDGVRKECTPEYQAFVMGPDKEVTMVLTLDEINATELDIFKAFPNFKFLYGSIEESLEEPGVIVLHDHVATGLHNGEAFAFGPFPPIPPTFKLVVLDASVSHYHFCPKTNLICKEEIIALGELTGPPGVYIQLGGKMTPPPPRTEAET